MGRLDALDLTPRLDRRQYDQRLAAAQRRWLQLRLHVGGQMGSGELGPGLLFVFEGSDAAGKGGAIKRLVEHLDPRHYRVSSFAKPTADEKRHPFLWRFSPYVPGLGGMSVFDRSWYGRVLVERIEGFATHDQWSRAYQEIVNFERANALEGVTIVKFWLQISSEEQLKRFEDRQNDPLRRWKITDEDWRNREKAAEYTVAAEEMFERTDHDLAPWDVISGEQKRLARVEVLETTIHRVEQGMARWGMPVPAADELGPRD
ncbi:MAG: UDP-galactose-lipid carrier transferase [Ilumatobacteraceae bacterium]|nr:UDP-galactose-lipid carrier transferase [Ilumatobacteraceae bacterium]